MSASKVKPALPLLREAALRDFVAAGAVTKVMAIGRAGGFELQVHMGTTVATLGNTRGGIRLFASIGPLIALLRGVGWHRFEVDATNFVAGRLRSANKSSSTKAMVTAPGRTKK
jgi:hypothetical protein